MTLTVEAEAQQGDDGLPADVKAECKALWKKYDDEAKAIIAPAGGDHPLRNKSISGAYSKLYPSDPCSRSKDSRRWPSAPRSAIPS